MKPTFLKVGVPRNTVRPPGTVRAPTETPGAANVPIPQFSHQKESPGPTHTIDLPDYAVGDIVFIAYQLNTTGHSVTSGWTALMGPTVTNGNELTVIARVMESGDGTTMTINAGGASTCWANVGIVEANGATFTTAGIDAAAAFWLGQNGASFNPPSVDASAAGDYFVFCGIFSNNIAFTSTTEPTDYTEIIEEVGGSPSHISTVAYRLVSITTSEDPGAGWGDTGGTRWGGAWTIAIPTSAGTPPVASGDHTHVEADVTDLAHTDTNAIHDNVASEISALTLVTAASGDHVLIEDASDSNNKKRVAASDFLGGSGGGGFNVALGKSYTLSTNPSGTYPEFGGVVIRDNDSDYTVNTVGGNLTDGYRGGGEPNEWGIGYDGWQAKTNLQIRIDLESAETINRFMVFGNHDPSTSIYCPTDLTLEYSSDDSNWTTVYDLSSLTSNPTGSKDGRWLWDVTVASVSARYWRFTFSQSGGWVFLSELELWT